MATSKSTEPTFELRNLFKVPSMRRVWKDVVRDGLRRQSIMDLHDCLDVHRKLDPILQVTRQEIIAGKYRPKEPEVITLEKKLGISRRLLIPTPLDALILQSLVESLQPQLISGQPTTCAYYARSHASSKVEDFNFNEGYPWWILWPEFQKQIWKFVQNCPYIATTDIASYFDTIPLAGLRNKVSSLSAFSETSLNFLFFMLEAFVWRPHYIPSTGVGLPQINFDAPRLLAHAYLFEIDSFLFEASDGNYVRWMDDIVFGAKSKENAFRILGELDERLNALGVRLNGGKTVVLNAKEATQYYWIKENLWLNRAFGICERVSHDKRNRKRLQRVVIRRYEKFRKQVGNGHHQKILKRYITLFAKLESSYLRDSVPEWLKFEPALRDHVFRYYRRLGFNKVAFEHIKDFVLSGFATDKVCRFGGARLLVEWDIPARSPYRKAAVEISRSLGKKGKGKTAIFISGLWVMAKYGNARELIDYLTLNMDSWNRSPFGVRHVAAVLPLLKPAGRRWVIEQIRTAGLLDGISVISSVKEIESLTTMDRQLRTYLYHEPKTPFPYPLHKFIIGTAVLRGKMNLAERIRYKDWLILHVNDKVYRSKVKEIQVV